MPAGIIISAALIWLSCLVLLASWQRRLLLRLWREPMLRRPVVIVESDDWGPGPPSDADALRQIADVLARHRDAVGRPAVMTLGMLLAVPDMNGTKRAGEMTYRAALISESRFQSILGVIQQGTDAGVFSAQLHGMEHYWPDSVLKAANLREDVREWLTMRGVPRTEDLPPELQSRWIDASELPSLALSDADVAVAAREEVASFTRIFGRAPAVVVPPTFVWTDVTEDAWAASGVSYIVTPGTRFVGRDREGGLIEQNLRFHNGESGPSGIIYLVRDDYFEPALGHKAERAVDAISAKTSAGRPTLLETHRFNFIGTKRPLQEALQELDRLLDVASGKFPGIRFMSTRELADCLVRRDTDLIQSSVVQRVRTWLMRAWQVPKLRKLACITGVVVPAAMVDWVIGSVIGDMAGEGQTT